MHSRTSSYTDTHLRPTSNVQRSENSEYIQLLLLESKYNNFLRNLRALSDFMSVKLPSEHGRWLDTVAKCENMAWIEILRHNAHGNIIFYIPCMAGTGTQLIFIHIKWKVCCYAWARPFPLLQVRLKWANSGNIAPAAIRGIVFIEPFPSEMPFIYWTRNIHRYDCSSVEAINNAGIVEMKPSEWVSYFVWLGRELLFFPNSISPPIIALLDPAPNSLLSNCNSQSDGFQWSLTMIWFREQLLSVEIVFSSKSNSVAVSVCVYAGVLFFLTLVYCIQTIQCLAPFSVILQDIAPTVFLSASQPMLNSYIAESWSLHIKQIPSQNQRRNQCFASGMCCSYTPSVQSTRKKNRIKKCYAFPVWCYSNL